MVACIATHCKHSLRHVTHCHDNVAHAWSSRNELLVPTVHAKMVTTGEPRGLDRTTSLRIQPLLLWKNLMKKTIHTSSYHHHVEYPAWHCWTEEVSVSVYMYVAAAGILALKQQLILEQLYSRWQKREPQANEEKPGVDETVVGQKVWVWTFWTVTDRTPYARYQRLYKCKKRLRSIFSKIWLKLLTFHLEIQAICMREPLGVGLELATTLRFLATGNSYASPPRKNWEHLTGILET